MTRKTIWTLNIDKYAPNITQLTYPLIERYAKKIGASFEVITTKKFPDWPVVYEKLQIFELGKNEDWNIYIDSDALVHPDLFDVTEYLAKDTVLQNGKDLAGNRWKYDRFFQRDGRHIGCCNWFTVASNWCRELWKPLEDLTRQQAVDNISLTVVEKNSGLMDTGHLVDDYTLSRNIAQYGLKFETFIEMKKRLGDSGDYLWHLYTIPVSEKVRKMREVLLSWGVLGKPQIVPGNIEGWMHEIELDWLTKMAATRKSIVEIGSWKGRSTAALLNGCPGTVFAVDTFMGSPSELDSTHKEAKERGDIFEQFTKNVGEYPNLQVLKMYSFQALDSFPDNSVDMVFIDGEHTEGAFRIDVTGWAKKCKGLLCGHDENLQPIKTVLNDLFGGYKKGPGKIWYVEVGN